ncbi:MAG: hypothetical protein K0Q73_9260, partial [Paenibacillus sp.]|nr:hypothetical protein [Paenibacillus sp.]
LDKRGQADGWRHLTRTDSLSLVGERRIRNGKRNSAALNLRCSVIFIAFYVARVTHLLHLQYDEPRTLKR